MTVYLVIGANRGIGLQLVLQLVAKHPSATVYGSARDVKSLSHITFPNFKALTCDVKNPDSVRAAADAITEGQIDVLINSAGICDEYNPVAKLSLEALKRHWEINTCGSVLVYQQFRELLLRSETKKLVFLSTMGGSIGGYFAMPSPTYGSSKAALNYMVRAIAAETKDFGLLVVAIHPGLVSSDMGDSFMEHLGGRPLGVPIITPEESACDIIGVVEVLAETDKFLNYDGQELPW